MIHFLGWKMARLVLLLLVGLMGLPSGAAFAEDHHSPGGSGTTYPSTSDYSTSREGSATFTVTQATYNADEHTLQITGSGAGRRKTVTVGYADSDTIIGQTQSQRDGTFSYNQSPITLSACNLVVTRYDGVQVQVSVCDNSSSGSDSGGGGTNTGGGGGTNPPPSGGYTLLAWNDLGMHCMDGHDFSVFSILPPYNNLHAQLVNRDATSNKLITSGVTVTYQATAYPDGAINTTSAGKTNFWDYDSFLYEPLFGPILGVDYGVLGNHTQCLTPEPMRFDSTNGWWDAEAIPTTPYDDDGTKDFYPLVKVVAKDASGNVLASTTTVLPISDELDCRACHASNSSAAAEPAAGWVNVSDPDKDYKLNILRLHDDKNDISGYLATLAQKGYTYKSSLYETAISGTPVLCSACHGDNALPGTGITGITPFTTAMHTLHAGVTDPTTGQILDDIGNRSACYRCHPGAETQCLRGAMGSAVNPDGTSMMQCQNCHGSMSAVGTPGRMAWLSEPACQSCHFDGQRATDTSARAQSGSQDMRFATNPDTPVAGTDLYRFSRGHGGLQCEACHGATHAIYPSAETGDNFQSEALQGHDGTIAECTVCHAQVPSTTNGGPHGLHTVGQAWVSAHESVAERGTTQCAACHGSTLHGGVLSETSMARTFQTEHGTITFAADHMVSCYDCHNGPGGG